MTDERQGQASGFLQELRRRHVVRTAVAYAAVVFAVLQLGEIVLPAFSTNAEALIRLLTVGAVLLFPVVVMVAWVYEITPMGIRSMAEVDAEAGVESPPHGLAHRLAFLGITVAAMAGAAAWWWSGADSVPAALSLRTASVFQSARTTDASGPIGSLAVLPLDDLSAEPGQEYFAPGMHEALISELSQIGSLRVISRTSVVQYSPQGRSVPQIGQDLGVDAIVEGSVLRAEGRVRVTVQLIHAASDTHLWSESYERDLSNIISLQREVAEAIAGEIERRLLEQANGQEVGEDTRLAASDSLEPGSGEADEGRSSATLALRPEGSAAGPGAASAREPVQGEASRTENSTAPKGTERTVTVVQASPEVQEAVLRGRVALFDPSDEGAGRALSFFRSAVDADSAFVPALTGLAGAYLAEGMKDAQLEAVWLDSARTVALRAVERDPRSPEAVEILRSAEEALQLLQGSVGEMVISVPETPLGQLVQEGLTYFHVRDESSTPHRIGAVIRLISGGRLDEGERMGRALLDEGVDDLTLWEGMEQLLRLRSDAQGLVELRVERREVRGSEPGPSVRELVRAMDERGAPGYWAWKREEEEARAEADVPFLWTSLATARMGSGDRVGALEALGTAAEVREPLLAATRQDPTWDPVRSDERFQRIVRSLRPEVSLPRPPGGRR